MQQLVSRAKPKRRTLDEIAEDIVLELGDARGQYLKLPEDETRAKVLRAVIDSTEFFHRWNEWHSREGRAAIADGARELADLVTAIKLKLEDLPEPLTDYLFRPPVARGTGVSADEFEAIVVTDRFMFKQRLERLRRDCQQQQPPPDSTCPCAAHIRVAHHLCVH